MVIRRSPPGGTGQPDAVGVAARRGRVSGPDTDTSGRATTVRASVPCWRRFSSPQVATARNT